MRNRICFRYILALALALVLAAPGAWAKKPKPSYKLTLTIKGNTDSVMYLGCYYLKDMYIMDTARPDKNGTFVFSKSSRKMMPGMYFFSNQVKGDARFVEFIVYHENPFFSFVTDDEDWQGHMKVTGSEENRIFFDYQQRSSRLFAEIDSMKGTMDNESFKAYYRQRAPEAYKLKEDVIKEHPESMISKIMRSTRPIVPPKYDSTGRELSQNERYDYYMTHFFDSIPLDDEMLLRTPRSIFYDRVTFYLDSNLLGQPPETIIRYVDMMIDRSRPAKEVFHWLVHNITNKYLQSTIMVYDEVYVHMIKKYYATGEAFWATPSSIDEEVKRATTWEKLLVGKVAPELMLYDTERHLHSLHAQQHKYTLLVFWSPTCGHCKTMIPELYKKYSQYKDQYDIGAFAILSEPDEPTREKWHKFIAANKMEWLNLDGGEANIDWREVYDIISTPQIYLLDKDKVIVGKKLNANSFEQLLLAIEGAK